MIFNKNDKVIVIDTESIWDNKEGKIIGDFDNDIISEETENYIVKVSFDNDKFVMQTFNKNNLKVSESNESLNESKNAIKKFTDFIRNYVYLEDTNGEKIHSWFFVDKLASVEDILANDVIDAALNFGYKIFMIVTNTFKKAVVAAPKCKVKDVYDDYASHLLGKAKVIRITDKGDL